MNQSCPAVPQGADMQPRGFSLAAIPLTALTAVAARVCELLLPTLALGSWPCSWGHVVYWEWPRVLVCMHCALRKGASNAAFAMDYLCNVYGQQGAEGVGAECVVVGSRLACMVVGGGNGRS